MEELILTDEEMAFILRRREDENKKAKRKLLYLQTIKTSYDFAVWMDKNGCLPTFSTFCNEFGYDELNASEMYKVVISIYQIVQQAHAHD